MVRKRKQAAPARLGGEAAAGEDDHGGDAPNVLKRKRGKKASASVAAGEKHDALVHVEMHSDSDAGFLLETFELRVVEPNDLSSVPSQPNTLNVRAWREDADRSGDGVLGGAGADELLSVFMRDSAGAAVVCDCVTPEGFAVAAVDLLRRGVLTACFEAPASLRLCLSSKNVEDNPGDDDERYSAVQRGLSEVLRGAVRHAFPSLSLPLRHLQGGFGHVDASYVYDALCRAPTPAEHQNADAENSLGDLGSSRLAAIRPTLRGYQRRAVQWMCAREADTAYEDDSGEQKLFQRWWGSLWRPWTVREYRGHEATGERTLYVCVSAGRVAFSPPPAPARPRGGVLADEMGLGKTVEVIATICANPRTGDVEEPLDSSTIDPKSTEQAAGACGACRMVRDPGNIDAVLGCWVRCDECERWSHASCSGVRSREAFDVLEDSTYVCVECCEARRARPLRARSTLIVVPQALLSQWCEELTKHVRPGALSVQVFEGVRSSGYIPARKLAQADVVLTTYDALRSDINRVEAQQRATALRNEKVYRTVPTPFLMLDWWRVCLDEAQMVENGAAAATQMALALSARIRWCVTGTPLRRSLHELHGLVRFVRVRPLDSAFWWRQAVLRGELSTDALRAFLQTFMWRTKKEHVSADLGLKAQESNTHRLRFSAVEAYYYRRQYDAVRDIARRVLQKLEDWRPLDGKHGGGLLLGQLLSLRQACCHPQVGGMGLRSINQTSRGAALHAALGGEQAPMTMRDVLDALLHRAKVECEDAQRLFIVALNGLAACCLIAGGAHDLARAAGLYREALQTAAKNERNFEMDRLQRLHILHNLADALRMVDQRLKTPNLPQGDADVLSGVGRTLREGSLDSEAARLRDAYAAEARAKLASTQIDFEEVRGELEAEGKRAAREGVLVWWAVALAEIERDSLAASDLLSRIRVELLDAVQVTMGGGGAGGCAAGGGEGRINGKTHSIASQFSSIAGLRVVLDRELSARESARSAMIAQLRELPGSVEPTAEMVARSGSCGKCRPEQSGPVCEHCEAEKLFADYERTLFSVRTRRINAIVPSTSREGVVTHGEGGVRLQSDVDKVLRIVLSVARRCLAAGSRRSMGAEELSSLAQRFFDHLELMHKEFKHSHLLFRAQKDLLSALDELDMATMRIHLRSPEEKVTSHEAVYKFLPEELPAANVSFSSDKVSTEINLRRRKGQMLYLQSLRQRSVRGDSEAKVGGDGSSAATEDNIFAKETCVVCLGAIGTELSVFPCGHTFCFDCTLSMSEKATSRVTELISAGGVERGVVATVSCPSCRSPVAVQEISYITSQPHPEGADDGDLDVRGSYGTKVTAVTRTVLRVLREDSSEKLLVFSQWGDVIEIVARSLQQNGVGFAHPKSGRQSFKSAIRSFRTDASISVLLLPIRSCASGLNLTEATHVLLVEPLLNPAAEAQAIGRVDRFGQTRQTVVHRFIVRDTIEERVLEVGRSKRQTSSPRTLTERITASDVSQMFAEA